VVTEGEVLEVDSLLISEAGTVSITADLCTSACTIMVSLSQPAGLGEEGILSVEWMGLCTLEGTRVW